jgi:ATP-dependent Lon protease
MVFIGNTAHTVPYMLKNSDLFDELPEQYHDPAFLDRLHGYIPGWEFEQIRGEMFSSGYGFVVDYLAEVLKFQRDIDYSDRFEAYFELSPDISTRDRDGILKTFSGLMKLIHPTGEATQAEVEALLRAAIEGRKRVKDQLIRIDTTMTPVRFAYKGKDGEWRPVTTLEESEYPELYYRDGDHPEAEGDAEDLLAPTSTPAKTATPSGTPQSRGRTDASAAPTAATAAPARPVAKPGHIALQDGRRGITYDRLFGPYLIGATQIAIVDPYVRKPYQARNLMEFLETVAKATSRDQEVQVHLTTKLDEDAEGAKKQLSSLEAVRTGAAVAGINFDYDFSDTIHDRSIVTNTGWRIILGRGLDIYQPFDTSWFDLRLRQQAFRQVKEFSITYIHDDSE